jgi:hypothetical protein
MIKNKVALYSWAMEDAKREMESDFKTVRTIVKGPPQAYVEMASALKEEDRLFLIQSLLKGLHGDALKLLGQTMTEEETAVVKRFRASLRAHGHTYMAWWLSRQRQDKPVSTARAATKLLARLKPVLGPKVHKTGGGEWSFMTPVGDQFAQTQVTIYRARLSCCHTISDNPEPANSISEGIDQAVTSILYWLGVAGTEWDIIDDESVPAVADSVAACAERFLELAKVLVEAG